MFYIYHLAFFAVPVLKLHSVAPFYKPGVGSRGFSQIYQTAGFLMTCVMAYFPFKSAHSYYIK